MKKEEKKELVAGLKDKLQSAKGMVIADYKGMTVAELSELRRQLSGSQIEFKVVKNTLARIAVKDTPLASAEGRLKGPVGIAIGYDDPVKLAKAVLEFSKKNQKLKVTGGVVDSAYYGIDDLKAVADLPPRPVLLGILAGVMQAPLSQLARLLAAPMGNLGYALSALKEKKA